MTKLIFQLFLKLHNSRLFPFRISMIIPGKVVLTLLFSVSFFTYSSPFDIKINGHFPGAQNLEVRLMEYGDLVSYREVEITASIVDEQGNFELNISRFEPQYVFLRIDHARLGFFVEPGTTYHLNFDPVDFRQLDDRINPYLNPLRFNYELEESGASTNSEIDRFEEKLYERLIEKLPVILISRNNRMFEEIIHEMDSIFPEIENPFFADYYRYKLAYYRHVSNTSRFENLVREYILNQPVLYTNPQYMNLFNVLFDKFIFSGSRRISGYDLRFTVNQLGSHRALMDSLGKDTILRNEVIRELVMLKGLQHMYDDPDYRRSNVIAMLKSIARESRFPQHRVIASNIIQTRRYLREGTIAPQLSIQLPGGPLKEIPGDYAGQFVYLVFWATWCESCHLDFIALRELASRYEDITVIAVSTDRHQSDFENFLIQNELPWENFHFGGDFRLLDIYQIRSIPTYVLIDREGKIIGYPAQRPSDELYTHIQWLLHQERRERR